MWPFKPNDWKLIHAAMASYTVYTHILGTRIDSSKRTEWTTARLYYSKSRNRYKIKEIGYVPQSGHETSDAYFACLNKQIQTQ